MGRAYNLREIGIIYRLFLKFFIWRRTVWHKEESFRNKCDAQRASSGSHSIQGCFPRILLVQPDRLIFFD